MRIWKPTNSQFYWYDFTWKGARLRQSTKQDIKKLAEIVAYDAFTKAKEQGTAALLQKSPTLTEYIPDFLVWIEQTSSIEPETKRFYKRGVSLLQATPLAGMKLSGITNHECEQARFPGDGYTANAALRTLRRVLTKAKETKQLFGELPKIKMRKVWGRSDKMTNAQCTAIATRLKGDPKDALLILRSTGMRPKECFAVVWEGVDFETGRYQIPRGKTKSAKREVPLLGESLDILRRRRLEQGQPRQGFVFPSDSKSGHIVNIHKAFIAARRAAGLPDNLVLYCARHGALSDFATVLPLSATMQIGGHSDARTAMGYQHHDITDLQMRLNEAKTNGRIN